jgi:hypothetical protein
VDIGTIVGLVSAVATIVAAIVLYRRQFPKRQIRYGVRVSPLVAQSHAGLELRYQGQVLSSPRLAIVRVRSRSRADIPSSSFDAGRAIRIVFDDRVIGSSSDEDQDIQWEIYGYQLWIPPQLIRAKSELEVSLVVDGDSDGYSFESPLVDIAALPDIDAGTRGFTILIVAASAMALVVVGLLVAGFVSGTL